MISTLLALPPHLRKRLADGIQAGLLGAPYTAASVTSVLGSSEFADHVLSALKEVEEMSQDEIAVSLIQAIDTSLEQTSEPDFVWSGPQVSGLHARDTRRVFEELLGSAEESLWACTYAYFDGPKAFDVLAQRMGSKPDLRVRLLLNIQRKRGDTTDADQLVRRFADRFWGTDWPGTARPNVYYDPRSLEEDGPGGVLHAKAVVADEEVVFVTSANLTEAALDRNIEIGMLYRNRAMAATLATHFQVLIDRGLLHPLPSS